MKPYKIIISGGGTGGHLFPAIAIAEEIKLRYPTAEILFVGALGRIEMTKVPAAGFEIIGLWIDGFQRSLSVKNLLFPIKLLFSLAESLFITIVFSPQCSCWNWRVCKWTFAVCCQCVKISDFNSRAEFLPGNNQ